MNIEQSRFSRPTLSLLLAAIALCSGSALASNRAERAEAAAVYKQELAACNNGETKQVRSACIDEARSAYAEAKAGKLGDGLASDAGNKSKRCEPLSGDERVACMARMRGQGTTSGTAADGGIIRELTTVQPPKAKTKTDPVK